MNPPALLFISVLSMLAVHLCFPVTQIIPYPWNALGAAPIGLGVALNVWADRLFKRARTTVKPDREPAALVAEGPYRFSRHPMYLGMIAISAGIAALLGTVTPLIVASLFTVLLALRFVPAEEQAMERVFGEAWGRYRRRVRKWF